MVERVSESTRIDPALNRTEVKESKATTATTLDKVRKNRRPSKRRFYPTGRRDVQQRTLPPEKKKPKLEESITAHTTLHSIILNTERFSDQERNKAIEQLKALEEKEIQKRRELSKADRAVEDATKDQKNSSRWSNIIECGQIATSIGTGIALLKSFVSSVGLIAPSPATALAGLALLVTGSVAGATKLINSTGATSEASTVVGNIVGDVAFVGSSYAFSQLDSNDRPDLFAIAVVLLKLSRATAATIRASSKQQLKQRQADWQELKTFLQKLSASTQDAQEEIEASNHELVQNMMSAGQALKEEEWARKQATRPIRG